MKSDQTVTNLAARVLEKLEPVLERERPDWILIQGDTTTSAATSIAAFYQRIKIAHIEAGLRTSDKWTPFPEEMNRRIIGLIADIHFAPTHKAKLNLLSEGVSESQIFVTGNTVIDALQIACSKPLEQDMGIKNASRIILVTAHRRENFGKPLRNICLAILEIAERLGDKFKIVYPVHPNPNVRKSVYRILRANPNIILIDPLNYVNFVNLMKRAILILTDSGGIQEEAPALGIPVLVLRETTERLEAVESGTARLVGTNRHNIVSNTLKLLNNPDEYYKMSRAVNPFGDGRAAERIVKVMLGKTIVPFTPGKITDELT